MWVFTESGFISIVNKGERGKLMVRARDRRSLEAVCDRLDLPRTSIYNKEPSDYGFRIQITPAQLSRYLELTVGRIDYSNFKDRVTETRGDAWHDALMSVWSAMYALQPRKTWGKPKRNKRARNWELEEQPEIENIDIHSLTDREWDQLMRTPPF